MGLIHSRASKKQAKAEAALLEEQLKQLKKVRKADRITVGSLIKKAVESR